MGRKLKTSFELRALINSEKHFGEGGVEVGVWGAVMERESEVVLGGRAMTLVCCKEFLNLGIVGPRRCHLKH